MKKTLITVLATAATAAVLISCGQSKTTETKVVPAPTDVEETTVLAPASGETITIETADAPTPEEYTVETQAAPDGDISGVVVDATMNGLTLQAEDGMTYFMSKAEDCDTAALADGLGLGNGVTATVKDGMATKLADAKTQADDRDALAAAGEVILAFEHQDMDALAFACSFPMYVGDTEIKSSDEFMALPAENIFTKDMIDAVRTTDLMAVEKTEAGIVLGRGDKPNVILSNTDDGWTVTGINY